MDDAVYKHYPVQDFSDPFNTRQNNLMKISAAANARTGLKISRTSPSLKNFYAQHFLHPILLLR
jgi:hypothetical protein